ncbi:hypothetical protein Vi05172_g4349 [Venturia inaequalis]|nr:hypothetical protein Vi05172_g4349 [Venturia inaequalis]
MFFNTASIIATLSVLLIATTNAAPNPAANPAANPEPNQDKERPCWEAPGLCNANCGIRGCIMIRLQHPTPPLYAVYCCA